MSVTATKNTGVSPTVRLRWGRIAGVLSLAAILSVSFLRLSSWQNEQHWTNAGIAELEAAVRQHPDDARLLRNLALRREQQGRDQDAFDAFTRAAAADGDDEAAWLGSARLTARLYGNQGALDLLSVYLKRHPNSSAAHRALAEIYLGFRAHRRVWEEATAVLRSDPTNADALRLKGIAEMSMNRLPDAESSLRQAVALAPQDWQASFAMAGVFVARYRNAEAETAYRRTISLAPSEVMPHLALAKLLFDTAKSPADLQNAHDEAERTVTLNPNAPGGYLLLGQIDARLSRGADARKDLLRARQQSPLEPAVAYELARVYQRTGDAANAASELARFRRLNAYLSEMRLLIERLSQNHTNDAMRLKLARLAASHADASEAARQYRLLLARNAFPDIARQELSRLTPP